VTSDQVTVERRIAARPETVFSFFTDRDRWLSWMGVDGQFAFQPGGAYRTTVTGGNHATGRFLEIDPPRRVVFTWGWENPGMPVPPGASTVEISLTPDGDGTLLRLVHTGLPPQARAPHAEGWNHYLDRLVTRAEGGDPGPDRWMTETPN
jgi:uncharacterized protein YndB with AHSA1/START domain